MDIIFILDYETYQKNLFEVAEESSLYVDKIWFRIKNIDANIILTLSKKLRTILKDKLIILSERADIATIAKLDGIHVGNRSLPVDILKKKFNHLTIGYSAHGIEEIKEIEADYFTLSPIFFTKKEHPVNPIGVVDVSKLNKKIYALGGINKENILNLLNKGYKGVAGISFLKDLPHIRKLICSAN